MSQTTLDIVKATVPVLKTRGTDITSHMYKVIVRDFPQVRSSFNMTHVAENPHPKPGEPKAPLQVRTKVSDMLAGHLQGGFRHSVQTLYEKTTW